MSLEKSLTEIGQNMNEMMRGINELGQKIQRQLDDSISKYRMEKHSNSLLEEDTLGSTSEKDSKFNRLIDVDQQIGALYGCIELRDAIKEAKVLMATFEGVLRRVGNYVSDSFVNSQMESLLQSLRSFHVLFDRMIDKMETMECETFFEELSDIRPLK